MFSVSALFPWLMTKDRAPQSTTVMATARRSAFRALFRDE